MSENTSPVFSVDIVTTNARMGRGRGRAYQESWQPSEVVFWVPKLF